MELLIGSVGFLLFFIYDWNRIFWKKKGVQFFFLLGCLCQAAAGAGQLQSNMPALLDGVKQLRDGAMQLSDGLKQFNEEGVEKLVSVMGDDVEGLAERLTATVEVSRNYRSFSGLTDGMDGAVRFIYRTEAVEKAE